MAKFRKKPVVVDAWEYVDSSACRDALEEMGVRLRIAEITERDGSIEIWNTAEECWVRCPPNHKVIRGVKGEFYPCKSDIFEATYERVADDYDTVLLSEVRGGEAP